MPKKTYDISYEKAVKDIAGKIKFRRKNCPTGKLSQTQLANATGVTKQHISNIETGRYPPSFDLLVKISVATKTELVISLNKV